MRFACDGCNAKYMISDDKVGPAGVKVRCKKCGHVILVHREEPEAPPPAPEGALAVEWWVAIDEQPVGPVTLEAVQGHWDQGRVGPESLVWYAGLAEWTPVSGVAELHAHLIGHSADAGSPRPGGFQLTLDEPEPPPPAPAPPPPPPVDEDWRPGAGDALAALGDVTVEAAAPASAVGDPGVVPTSAAEPPAPEPTPVHLAAPTGSDPTDVHPLSIQGLERTGEQRIGATPGTRGPRAASAPPRPPERTGRPLTVVLVVALVIVAAAAAGLWYLTR